MNITSALWATTVFIFFLLPGVIMLRALWASDKGPLQANNFYSYLLWGSLASVILYPLAFELVNLCNAIFVYLHSSEWRFQDIASRYVTYLFCGVPIIEESIEQFVADIFPVLLITLLTDILAYFIGKSIRTLTTMYNLDIQYPIFRFRNDWYYLLKGKSEVIMKTFPQGVSVKAHIMCEVGGAPIIYEGNIVDYRLDKDDTLENIHLSIVRRTAITSWDTTPNDKNAIDIDLLNTNPKFYLVPGERMLIKMADIKNINLYYEPVLGGLQTTAFSHPLFGKFPSLFEPAYSKIPGQNTKDTVQIQYPQKTDENSGAE